MVEAVLDPSAELRAAAEAVLRAAADSAGLPDDIALHAGLDRDRLARTGRAAAARFGVMRLALPAAGDGVTTAPWSLGAERGGLARLRIALDPETRELREAALLVADRATPAEGW